MTGSKSGETQNNQSLIATIILVITFTILVLSSKVYRYTYIRKGYASQVSPAIEEVTGRKPTTFDQFAKDHADAFR